LRENTLPCSGVTSSVARAREIQTALFVFGTEAASAKRFLTILDVLFSSFAFVILITACNTLLSCRDRSVIVLENYYGYLIRSLESSFLFFQRWLDKPLATRADNGEGICIFTHFRRSRIVKKLQFSLFIKLNEKPF